MLIIVDIKLSPVSKSDMKMRSYGDLAIVTELRHRGKNISKRQRMSPRRRLDAEAGGHL